MFSTKSVQSLHNLFKGYHQPTISQQKSVKLLENLKTSFRKQLDREYGPSSDAPSTSKSKFSKQADSATSNLPDPERDPVAIQHLKSILSNPLFAQSKSTASPSVGLATAPKQDPVRFFDNAVARDMMTLKAATGCLITKQKQLALHPRDNMASSRMGSRVVRWLQLTGAEEQLAFLKDSNFLYALTPFLVAEGLEESAWTWIKRAMQDKSVKLNDTERVNRASYILSQLVRAQCQPQHGSLDSAISTILRAEQEFNDHPLLSKLLVLPWRSVSWMTTVEAFSRTPPTENLFDAHMATAGRLDSSVSIETAHLHLYHPTHPDHSAATKLFTDTFSLRRIITRLSSKKETPRKSLDPASWLALLGQDTVNHLLQSGNAVEAKHITNILNTELPDAYDSYATPAGLMGKPT
jgi:hypothetical protein